MTVRKVKGKWQFGYKDTYSLDSTLSPIICAGLKKFLSVLEERNKTDKCFGIPGEYVSDNSETIPDEDVEKYFDDLRLMIYAFDEDEVPSMSDYDFKINMTSEPYGDKGYSRAIFETIGQDEYDRYREDVKEHEEKCCKGRELMFQKWGSLWW